MKNDKKKQLQECLKLHKMAVLVIFILYIGVVVLFNVVHVGIFLSLIWTFHFPPVWQKFEYSNKTLKCPIN